MPEYIYNPITVMGFPVMFIFQLDNTGNVYIAGTQESRREGWTDVRSAVGFCLGSGLFGSYNSD